LPNFPVVNLNKYWVITVCCWKISQLKHCFVIYFEKFLILFLRDISISKFDLLYSKVWHFTITLRRVFNEPFFEVVWKFCYHSIQIKGYFQYWWLILDWFDHHFWRFSFLFWYLINYNFVNFAIIIYLDLKFFSHSILSKIILSMNPKTKLSEQLGIYFNFKLFLSWSIRDLSIKHWALNCR
jgi:hypothetical protein